ncbi:hypothetical protein BXY66_0157 [Shimia isoporae]|uniref:DUF2125 domain-containing protein n=1 Tax=Shimia isoporae TaxID=647720 RepID=A0A4R1NJ13_9RHOB|nr:DUF2125 domain-containing protein [Shimia isoporae]TCL08124.1 hypothetical protein BXY66_0157 [Shimia isoporae]
MKWMARLMVLGALVWGGFWLAGYYGAKSGFATWFEDRRADGWVAEYDELSVSGFPNRIDTTFTQITLADPETGVAWEAPFFQLFALTYKPHHLIAVWPNEQTLAVPTEKLSLKSEDMRASLVLHPGTDLALERINVDIDTMALSSSLDWQMTATGLDLALHRQPTEGDQPSATYRLAFRATDLAPPAAFSLPSGVDLPRTFEVFQADLHASFTRPWDISAIEDDRPQPTKLDLKRADIVWGDLVFNAAGAVSIDNLGYPTGELTFRLVNWQDMIAVARESGRVAPAVLDTLEQALTFVAGLSGNKKQLDIPLTFKGGTTRFGPIPIGPAPRIVIR